MAIGGYRTDGSYRFGALYGGPASDFVDDLALSASGDLYLTGAMGSPFDLGGGPLDGFGGRDIVVASFDRSSTYRWATTFGSSSDDNGFSIALGPQSVVVVGGIGGTLQIGDQHFVSAGGNDILLLVLKR
jgi:pyruvate/2-oxoacid:ferredoxin oxidoreductase beta subunit